jgi:serine/threonine protein kinase
MTDPSASQRDVIDELAESFVARLRAGERPTVEQYVARYPELADEVRQLLPTLMLLEQHASLEGCSTRIGKCSSHAEDLPREIGDYTIIREIGRGGMGVVYEAVEQSLGRHVALKVLSGSARLQPSHLERFRLEARAAAKLHHTHIVPVFGVGESAGAHYYAMQFIPGKSLDLVIEELRRLKTREGDKTRRDLVTVAMELTADTDPRLDSGDRPPDVSTRPNSANGSSGFYHGVARVGLQVAEALAYAHGQGILHRDIKPSNLLLDARGNTWITDFGLAKDESVEGFTRTGDLLGTLRYMAPERIDGWSDPRSDVYSLGATLYELVTLRPFFESTAHGRLVEQILYNAPTAPGRLDAGLPKDLETIVLKAIAKEPAARYRTATEMADDLQRFLTDRPVLARRSTALEQLARWRRRNPLIAALAGAVAVLALLALVILANSNLRIREESDARAAAIIAKNNALATAHDAIDQMLRRTADETFADAPRLHPVRVALLEDALRFYDQLASASQSTPLLRHEIARVLQTKAGLERELDRHAQAAESLRQGIQILESVLSQDPEPPGYLEELAVAHQDLGLTLYYAHDPPLPFDAAAEAEFREAVGLFEELERGWPARKQPVVLATRYLGTFASHRGRLVEAEQLFRTAIDRGEAYVAQHPEDVNELHETAWACTNLYDLEMLEPDHHLWEAEAILMRGLEPLEAQLRKQPTMSHAIDVASAVRIRLAACWVLQGRTDDAAALYRRTIADMQQLCEAFPWNDYYWGNLTWFHEEMSASLRTAHRTGEAEAILDAYRQWLDRMATQLPNEPGPREKLQAARRELGTLQRDAQPDP